MVGDEEKKRSIHETLRADLRRVIRPLDLMANVVVELVLDYVVWDVRRLTVGDLMRARDSGGHWYHAQLMLHKGNQWLVDFVGWSSKWREWIPDSEAASRFDEAVATQIATALTWPRPLGHIGQTLLLHGRPATVIAVDNIINATSDPAKTDWRSTFHLRFPAGDTSTLTYDTACFSNVPSPACGCFPFANAGFVTTCSVFRPVSDDKE